MKLSTILTPAVVIAVLALAPIPAFAQHGGGHGGGGGHSGGGARMGGGSRGGARAAAPRGGTGTGTAVPRGGYYGGYGRYGGYGYGRYGLGRFGYGGFGYGRFGFDLGFPYYAFSPDVALGFGLYAGYPVSYPYWAFPSPYVYGYPSPSAPGYSYPGASADPGAYAPGTANPPPNAVTASGSGVAQQGQAPAQGQYGGLSFQVTPTTAQVSVDGVYMAPSGNLSLRPSR